MRPGPLAAIALLSAVIGGAAVLAVAVALDWVDPDGAESVVTVPSFPLAEEEDEAPRSIARPLEGTTFDPAGIYRARVDGVVTIYAYFGDDAGEDDGGGQGSGFVVSPEGHVLTNAHVATNAGIGASGVRAADEVYVEFRDADRIPAEVVGWDLFDDVALLKVDPAAHALRPLPLGDSSRVVVGEPVVTIGTPFGAESSLATGIVSATGRSIPALTSRFSLVDAIQIDAPLNRGNSGGPLLDAGGRVIGINAQIRTDSGLAEGVGFAVPINAAKRTMRELIANGRVAYAYIGVRTNDVWPALARELELDAPRGAIIAEAVAGGPAAEAGIRGGSRTLTFQGRSVTAGGDVVIAVDGRQVRSGDDLVRIVTNDLRPGTDAVFTVLRGDRRVDLRVAVTERPPGPAG